MDKGIRKSKVAEFPVCFPCREGSEKIAFYRKNPSGRPQPVFNWELCANRSLRCRYRANHLRRMIAERQKAMAAQ